MNSRGAREDIIDARDELRDAEEDFEPYEDWAEDNQTRRDFKESVDEAQREYDEALRRLRALQLEKSSTEAAFELAQATLQDARREYQRWQNGPDPDEVDSLEARIAASQATIALSRLEAPFTGTVTMVDVLPGDQVSPGMTALRIDDLSHLPGRCTRFRSRHQQDPCRAAGQSDFRCNPGSRLPRRRLRRFAGRSKHTRHRRVYRYRRAYRRQWGRKTRHDRGRQYRREPARKCRPRAKPCCACAGWTARGVRLKKWIPRDSTSKPGSFFRYDEPGRGRKFAERG
jgi:biotin carboxyl carrier protein